MKDIFIQEAKKYPQDLQAHILREKIQKLILNSIDKKNFFSALYFVGGTALRLLYKTKRFSEDLYFSLDPAQKKKFNFKTLIRTIRKDLEDYQFIVETKEKKRGAVQNCFFKFPNLLHELSPRFKKNEKLSIRLDVDTNPPAGFKVETSTIPDDFILLIKHYDKPSLFAGKLHAILCRPYLKGRDIYDFIWYCAHEVPVNLTLLNNAYRQTEKKAPPWTEATFSKYIEKKILRMDFKKARKDASFFLENKEDQRLFTQEVVLGLAKKLKPQV